VVASGKEVTIHEAPISAHGFSGSGYTVIDPQTGAGSYVIEGGARGAFFVAFTLMAAAIILPLLAGLGLATTVIAVGLSFANFIDFVNKMKNISNEKDFNELAQAKALSALLSLLGLKIKLSDLGLNPSADQTLSAVIPVLLGAVGYVTSLAVTDVYRSGCLFIIFVDCNKQAGSN
jgi:hypothetical protein